MVRNRAARRQTRRRGKAEEVRADDDSLKTLSAIGHYLGFSRQTIREWRKNRGLPAIQIGRRLRFRKDEVDAWLARQV